MHHTLVKVNPTYRGYIDSTADVLLILQAVLDGRLAAVGRRPYEIERPQLITSGNVFVFVEELSRIRRWTDGVRWSPSRILGKFLVYRELEKRRRTTPPALRSDGLIKKALSLQLFDPVRQQRETIHLISYYSKGDLQSRSLVTPSCDPFFETVRPCPELIEALDKMSVGGGSRAGFSRSVAQDHGASATPTNTPPLDLAHPNEFNDLPAPHNCLPSPFPASQPNPAHTPMAYYYQRQLLPPTPQVSRPTSAYPAPIDRTLPHLASPPTGKNSIQLPPLLHATIPPPLPHSKSGSSQSGNLQLQTLPPFHPIHTQPRISPHFSELPPPRQTGGPPSYYSSTLPPVASITAHFPTNPFPPTGSFRYIS